MSMGVLDGTRVLYVHRLFAHGTGQYMADLELGTGAFAPAYCTAIGKAPLASLSAPDRREAIAGLKLKLHGGRSRPMAVRDCSCREHVCRDNDNQARATCVGSSRTHITRDQLTSMA